MTTFKVPDISVVLPGSGDKIWFNGTAVAHPMMTFVTPLITVALPGTIGIVSIAAAVGEAAIDRDAIDGDAIDRDAIGGTAIEGATIDEAPRADAEG
jgi:hypothetical protein